MRLRSRGLVRMLVVVLSLFCTVAVAQVKTAPELRVGVRETALNAAPADIEQLPMSGFNVVPAASIVLRGDPDKAHWLRLDVDLPPPANDARWMLWFDRVYVDRLAVYRSGETDAPASHAIDFFKPRNADIAHPGGYAYAFPRGMGGSATLFVRVVAQGDISLSPRIRAEARVDISDRNAVMLFTAVYTGLILLMLIGVSMYIALRDRLYLYYLAYLGAMFVFLLASNGHLYALPWIGKLGHWRVQGVYVLSGLFAATTVALARQFATFAQAMPRTDRLLALFPAIPCLLAVLCLFNRPEWAHKLQVLSIAAALVATFLAVFATAMAWRRRRHLALPMLLMWLLQLVAACVSVLLAYGRAPSNGWTQYGYQIVAALTALMLGFALSDRIIEFRQQRDRARLAKDQADASLRLERERRKFVESLAELRGASGGDQEWLAFRHLLEVLRQLIPQHSSAVALNAFQGSDLLLCEPKETRDDYQALLTARGGAFKGISRSQLPMQLRIDPPAVAGQEQQELLQYAVLPMPLTAPSWGVLLIERRGWQTFERDELALASEFVQKATQAVEAAAADRALRRSAEFDALTGAFNRRTMNARLGEYFKQSLERNTALVVLFVELDQLKELNDKHGHAAGDRSLRALSEALSKHCEKVGEYGRYGGDEFVVMLRDMNPENARHWAETMRADATSRELAFPSGRLQLHVSVGIASRRPEDGTVKELVERAGSILQEAKRKGLDQVLAAPGYNAVRVIGT